jgi:hypothetical protein
VKWLVVLVACASPRGPTMIVYEADWCAACRVLERTTLVDPAVVAESQRFTVRHVEGEVPVLPTIELVDSRGVASSLAGAVGPRQLLAVMRRVE